jgi:hypothetical protein
MSDTTPHRSHAEDARPDDAPPTDAVIDDVREDAASAEEHASAEGDPEEPEVAG